MIFSAPAPVTTGQFRLCDPREATSDAYVMTFHPEAILLPGAQASRPMSGGLVRAQLVSARRCDGSMALDDLSGTVAFTYQSGMFHRLVQIATPITSSVPMCGTCDQWESEHRNPNASACDRFDPGPRPGTDANPWCSRKECGRPRTQHGHPFTVACHSFES